MNPMLCPAYNADYDGDEMNIFYINDYNSIAESKYISSPKNCIISPQNNKPIIYLSQDYILALYLLTNTKKKISKKTFYNCKCIYNNFTKEYKKLSLNFKDINSKNLISLAFPAFLNYEDNNVKIKNGILLNGCINKLVIIDIIKKLSNEKTVSIFLYNMQLILNEWIKNGGISIGYEDCYTNIENYKHKSLVGYKDINLIMNKIYKNTLLNISKDNTIKNIISSGSKGSYINLYQITSSLGQQYIKNKIPKKLIFDKNYIHPGFCINSYKSGLNNIEYFYHSQSAREGIISTNIKTPNVGYSQRRLLKFLENLIKQYNNNITFNNYIIY